jgi:hypothetical protein
MKISSFLLDEDNLLFSEHYSSATSSTFHVDPFGMAPPPIRDSNSPLNMLSPNLFVQSQPQLIPNRLPAPIVPITTSQSPLNMKKLSLNPPTKKTDPFNDLLDFSSDPPPSPKFDPYA